MTETSSGLLDGLQNGDPAAWERLLAVYEPLLRRWLGIDPALRAEADDLVQDILQSVVRKLPDFRRQRCGSFRCWLRVITANRVNLFWRRRRNRPPVVDGEASALLISQLEDPDSPLSRQWDADHDRYVLRRLMALVAPEFRPQTWEAFRRHALDGVPAAEVARELGMSRKAVLAAGSRVLKRLREEARGLID